MGHRHRILNASSMFDEQFILMYSDNFVQHKFDALFSKYVCSDSPIAIHLSPKNEGNISLSDKNLYLSICLLSVVSSIPMSIWAI